MIGRALEEIDGLQLVGQSGLIAHMDQGNGLLVRDLVVGVDLVVKTIDVLRLNGNRFVQGVMTKIAVQ